MTPGEGPGETGDGANPRRGGPRGHGEPLGYGGPPARGRLWSDPFSGPDDGETGDGREMVRRHQRGRLLRAAVEVTAEVGYRNLTLRRLTAAAGMSIPTLHEHFDGVEDCLLAAYDEAIEGAIALATRAYEQPDGSPADRLERALRTLLRFAAEEPAVARTCLLEAPGAGPPGQERHLATMRRAGELVAHALSDVTTSNGAAPRRTAPLPPARLLHTVLAGGILQIVQQRIEEGETDRLPDLAPALANVCTAPLGESP